MRSAGGGLISVLTAELAVAFVLACFAAVSTCAAEARFVQDRFAIGFWVAPQTDENLDSRYAEIAEANFTFVIGLCGAKNPPPAGEQLKLCEKHGLKALVHLDGLPLDKLPESPACWGYAIEDEPNASRFAALRNTVDTLRHARPGKLSYINLFPNYASPGQLGTKDYDEHVSRFMSEVRPDVLSMDHYPQFRPEADGRDNYCRNLEVMRRESITAGIPFWNFFNTMPYGPHIDPTETQLRWQIFTSLAHGAKGVMYFCYWTPRGGEFPKGGAILTADGRRTRHYDEAKRINTGLKHLGPTLMNLTSTGVHRVKPKSATPDALQGSPVRSISEGDYLIGLFRHADGRRAVLLNNYHFAYSAWPTVVFDAEPASILEVSPKTGRAGPRRQSGPARASAFARRGRRPSLPSAVKMSRDTTPDLRPRRIPSDWPASARQK